MHVGAEGTTPMRALANAAEPPAASKELCAAAAAMRARHNAGAAAAVRQRLQEERACEQRARKRARRSLRSCGLESDDDDDVDVGVTKSAGGDDEEDARGRVLEVVRGALKPFHRAGVLSREQHKDVATRATARVLRSMGPAGAAPGVRGGAQRFLARNGAKVSALVQQYVRAVVRQPRVKN